MNQNTIFFLIEFVISFILPSLAILSILAKVKNKIVFRYSELIFLSLCVGPALNTWLTNLLLLLIPGLPHLFYIIFPTSICLLSLALFAKELPIFATSIRHYICSLTSYRGGILVLSVVGSSVTVFCVYQLYAINNFKITGSDQLVYAQQGKIMARDTLVQYKRDYFDDKSKFYYIALQGFSYPMFSTINYLYNYSLKFSGDLLFVNVSNYYLLLIVLIVFTQLYYGVSLRYRHYALVGTFVFLMSPIIILLSYIRSIDTFRVALLMLSLLALRSYFKESNYQSLTLLGITLGLSSNSHIINLVLSVFVIFSTLFNKIVLRNKIQQLFILLFITFLSGAYHYPAQILFGDGWLFRKNYSEVIISQVAEPITTNISKEVSVELNSIKNKELERREINTKPLLIKNGLLGIFLRVDQFGILNCLFPILFLVVIGRKYLALERKTIIGIFLMIAFVVVIIFQGYTSFRYQFTLHPIIFFLTWTFLFTILDKSQIKKRCIPLIIVFIFLVSVLNSVFTLKNDLISYVRKYAPSSKKVDSTTVEVHEIEKIIKNKSTQAVVTFVKDLRLDENETILASGTRLLNYYTDAPAYFFNSVGKMYIPKGKTLVCTNNAYNSALNLKEAYGINYLVIRSTDPIPLRCIRSILDDYSTVVFDSGSYVVYKLTI